MSRRRLRPLLAILFLQISLFSLGLIISSRPNCSSPSSSNNVRPIYFITATYGRAAQLADLTRLSQTLRHVPALYWVLVEDGDALSPRLTELLLRSGLNFVHLNAQRPNSTTKPPYVVGKGAYCREKGLQYVKRHGKEDAVVYFGDDDNTYDLRLFEELRMTDLASVFPVGLILKFGVSAPIVVDNVVVGFHDAFQAGRKFALDMAGFAVNLALIRAKNASMSLRMSYMEDDLLVDLGLELTDLRPLAQNCTQILVWHTRTESCSKPSLDNLAKEEERTGITQSNLAKLYENNFGLRRERKKENNEEMRSKGDHAFSPFR